jgi:ubiquinone/menaquinone biosynthesis C-methylase UbiE
MDKERIAFRSIRFMHETMYKLFRDAERPLRDAGLRPGMQVLEVGCGPGFFTLPAARIVGESGSVFAIDLNRHAVEHVQRKIAQARATNVQVAQADASSTDFPDGSFDLAFLFGLRGAVGGISAVLDEMYRVLRPDGLLATEGPLVPSEAPFHLHASKGRIRVYEKASVEP